MPDKLYGGLSEEKFRTIAKTAVRDYWNANVRNCGRFCNSVLTLWVDGACTFTNIGTKVETE